MPAGRHSRGAVETTGRHRGSHASLRGGGPPTRVRPGRDRHRSATRRGRAAGSSGWRTVGLALTAPLVVLMSIWVVNEVTSSWEARDLGAGIRGTFTVVDSDCSVSSTATSSYVNCWARGDFVSGDGAVVRRGVDLGADDNHLRQFTSDRVLPQGLSMPAVDTGSWTTVYPLGGGGQWGSDIVLAAVVVAGLGWWCWGLTTAVAARRARRAHTLAATPP
jgi:hypothetical protein